MFTTLVILGIAILLLCGMALRLSVGAFEPVRSAALGPLTLELRRRVVLRPPGAAKPGGTGLVFDATHVAGVARGGTGGTPDACEQRLRVWRVAGVPLWRQSTTQALPPQVATMTATLTARDFDIEFDERFRVASFNRWLPRWMARLRRSGAGLTRAEG